jgi:hypothetical protein
MTLPRPLPPHGTYGRAVGRPQRNIPGCRCDDCRAEVRRYSKRRHLLNGTGRHLTVSAGPATEHVRALVSGGAEINRIAAAATCSSTSISRLLSGQLTKIWRSTEIRILNTRLTPGLLSPFRPVSSVGVTRRVRALMAIGHNAQVIGDAIGSAPSFVRQLAAGTLPTVRASTAERVARAYRHLVLVAGKSTAARRRALDEGWAGPMAWDTSIDDPSASPDLIAPPALTRRELAQLRTAEITLLTSCGVASEEIARQLGVGADYVRSKASMLAMA